MEVAEQKEEESSTTFDRATLQTQKSAVSQGKILKIPMRAGKKKSSSGSLNKFGSDGSNTGMVAYPIHSQILNKSPLLVPLSGKSGGLALGGGSASQEIDYEMLQFRHHHAFDGMGQGDKSPDDFLQSEILYESAGNQMADQHSSAILNQSSIQNNPQKISKVRKISNLPKDSRFGSVNHDISVHTMIDQNSPKNSFVSQVFTQPALSQRAANVSNSYDALPNFSARASIHHRGALRSHYDGVRDIEFLKMNDGHDPFLLASVSQDCQLRVWNLSNFLRSGFQSGRLAQMEPSLTCRGHTGPLFAVTSANIQQGNLVYTGGVQGSIRVWHIPEQMPPRYSATDGQNSCVGVWTSHKDVIWELHHHNTENQLISVSSDGTVKLWNDYSLQDCNESIEANSNKCLLGSFINKYTSPNYIQIPTSASWVPHHPNTLLISYITPVIGVFDRTGRNKGQLTFEVDSNVHYTFQQVNKVQAHSDFQIVMTAHENKYLRFFDLKSNVQIKGIIAHTDALTSITVAKNRHHVITSSHDGSLRLWDLRKFQCIFDIQAHRKKFDESIYAAEHHKELPMLATGRAELILQEGLMVRSRFSKWLSPVFEQG